MITLVAIICSGILCQDVVVPTDMMAAGRADDPTPMPFSWSMCEADGQRIAIDWLAQQQQFRGWEVTKVECVPGKYESNKRA